MKCVVKKKNAELDTLNSELKKAEQTLKSRDKEVYNLENVKMNNLDKIKALKDDFNRIKREKSSLEKQLINKEKKVTKSRSQNLQAESEKNLTTSHGENLSHSNPSSDDMIKNSNLVNNNTFNNSMKASYLPNSLSSTLPSVEKEACEKETELRHETFLTEDGVKDILEKAMKKQRIDLKLFKLIDD